MTRRRIAFAALILLCLVPLAVAKPPPAYAGAGTAVATIPGIRACTVLVQVLLVDYPDSEYYRLDYNALNPDPSCPGRGVSGLLVTGSPATGFTWDMGCDVGSIGPLGSATSFEARDVCRDILIQGTVDFTPVF